MPGVITCPGLGDGEAVGICIPGGITCGLGDGDAAGICIPGVMTCGLGDGEGLGLAVLRVVVRLVRGVRFFGVARFGFGVAAFGFGITCPSCCGKALLLSANTIAREQNAHSIRFVSDQFIFPPSGDCDCEIPTVLIRYWNKQRDTQISPAGLCRSICRGN
jgi:hypothetical protein